MAPRTPPVKPGVPKLVTHEGADAPAPETRERSVSMVPFARALRVDIEILDVRIRPLVPTGLRAAVAARLLDALVPVDELAASSDALESEAAPEVRWPADVSAQALLDWLGAHAPDRASAEQLREAVRTSPRFAWPDAGRNRTTPAPTPATEADLLFAAWTCHAWQAVERDRRRPAIAIDAGRSHHELLTLHRRQPKHVKGIDVEVFEHRYVIRVPGVATRLALPRGEPHTALLDAFRDWKDWHGLRVWAALLWLASKAGRTGFLLWKLDEHLIALGYSERMRRDGELRARLEAEVRALTQTWIEVYDSSGRLQLKDTILRPGIQASVLRNGQWELEGMQLQISPILYRGVRDYDAEGKPGEFGTLWYPAPVELAQIDVGHFPHALALGFILPIRWRWDLRKRDHLPLEGKSLLEVAGIPVHRGHLARSMTVLRNSLDELVRLGGLGRYEWTGGEPWDLKSICRLYPPSWTIDRTLHGVTPMELPAPALPATGAALEAWRRVQGLTQAQLAARLEVSARTIMRAEGNAEGALSPQLRKALQSWSSEVTLPGGDVGRT